MQYRFAMSMIAGPSRCSAIRIALSGSLMFGLLFRPVGVRGSTAMAVSTIEIVVANLMVGVILGVGMASLGAVVDSIWLLTAALIVMVLVVAVILPVWRLVFPTEASVKQVLACSAVRRPELVFWTMLCAFGTPAPVGGVVTIYAGGCLFSM